MKKGTNVIKLLNSLKLNNRGKLFHNTFLCFDHKIEMNERTNLKAKLYPCCKILPDIVQTKQVVGTLSCLLNYVKLNYVIVIFMGRHEFEMTCWGCRTVWINDVSLHSDDSHQGQ